MQLIKTFFGKMSFNKSLPNTIASSTLLSVLTCLAAVILGALEFTLGKRAAPIDIRMGICYYLQVPTYLLIIT